MPNANIANDNLLKAEGTNFFSEGLCKIGSQSNAPLLNSGKAVVC
jgi:hypothetical protein